MVSDDGARIARPPRPKIKTRWLFETSTYNANILSGSIHWSIAALLVEVKAAEELGLMAAVDG
jgi:hypothetical protein